MRRWSEEWRGNTTSRLVHLTLRAARGPVPSLSDLARECGVHRRTIARYLTEIERQTPIRRVEA